MVQFPVDSVRSSDRIVQRSIIISIHDTFQIYPRIYSRVETVAKRDYSILSARCGQRGVSKFKSLCATFQIGKREWSRARFQEIIRTIRKSLAGLKRRSVSDTGSGYSYIGSFKSGATASLVVVVPPLRIPRATDTRISSCRNLIFLFWRRSTRKCH